MDGNWTDDSFNLQRLYFVLHLQSIFKDSSAWKDQIIVIHSKLWVIHDTSLIEVLKHKHGNAFFFFFLYILSLKS